MKVLTGRYESETGMIVGIDDNKAIVLNDGTKDEVNFDFLNLFSLFSNRNEKQDYFFIVDRCPLECLTFKFVKKQQQVLIQLVNIN